MASLFSTATPFVWDRFLGTNIVFFYFCGVKQISILSTGKKSLQYLEGILDSLNVVRQRGLLERDVERAKLAPLARELLVRRQAPHRLRHVRVLFDHEVVELKTWQRCTVYSSTGASRKQPSKNKRLTFWEMFREKNLEKLCSNIYFLNVRRAFG